ncbi:DUF6090 family protein [Seonamhaeicola maritimus]|uniref:DUF6090 family protein n=1 Tax=Seonamhaeicola maritimus TaxID=2591822 RepID=UPI0024958A7F|nr:DUF6090 family protein [Seonamhaeicola maritimus]
MIKFFRKIRQRLLIENKLSKYIIYAIGEIILVVIGILIALNINNWNEERKTKLSAQNYINEIVNDLVIDTLNINTLILKANDYKMNVNNYFSYFNQANVPIEKFIDSSKNIRAGYLRYIPVNHTFLDMQSSGNTNLLNKTQRNLLIDLSSEHEQLQIIIEKVISSSLSEMNERNRFLGYPDDFFDKFGKTASENNKLQWLIHQHLSLNRNMELYYFIEKRGEIIKEMSKKTILILKENDT